MRLFLFVLMILLSGSAFTQPEDSLLDRLMAGLDRHARRQKTPGLFLHLDKSVYEHSEHIQFTAWLLGRERDTARLHAVYVLLVDPATRKLVDFERYALSRFAAAGALYLEDSLHPGRYIVLAYTDDRLQGYPQSVFRQEITLLPDEIIPFSLAQQPDTAHFRFRISTSYGGLGSGGSFSYRLRVNDRVIDSGKRTIDAFGEVSIGAIGPSGAATTSGLPVPVTPVVLTATVSRQDQKAFFWLPVTVGAPEWRVHFYPEGGNLVAGHPSQIGIEIRDATGAAVRAEGRLLEDGNPVATFDTDNDGWGMLAAEFRSGHSYSTDFPDKPGGVRVNGSLPAPLPQGYSLLVSDGVVRDSFTVRLYLPGADLKCRLLIYNDGGVVYASSVLAHCTSAHVTIQAKDWPSGLLTMTLFDPDGLPVAERKLYCPAPSVAVNIVPDSAVYHPRSKIRLLIHTTNEKGEGIPGLFSLATVLSSRLNPDGDPDIRRYSMIDRFLSTGSTAAADPGYGLPSANWDSDTAINLLLLIRGWTRYHWEEIAADSLPLPAAEPVADYGYVLYRNKKPKTPVIMLVMGGGLTTFDSDSAGRFRVPPANLVSDRNKNLALSLAGGDKQDDYKVVLLNRYDSVNHALATIGYIPRPITPVEDKQPRVQGFLHAKTLQKVIVRPNGNGQPIPGCEDYVCIYNILNCRNHPYGRKPVVGERVLEQTPFGGYIEVLYNSCRLTELALPSFLSPIKPICLLKESYVNDTTPIPPSVTALNTTLHWAPLVLTDAAGNAEVSFYANDLPGEYDNVLQGISTQGVISGRRSFRIEKKVE